jgi:hypothetical protein
VTRPTAWRLGIRRPAQPRKVWEGMQANRHLLGETKHVEQPRECSLIWGTSPAHSRPPLTRTRRVRASSGLRRTPPVFGARPATRIFPMCVERRSGEWRPPLRLLPGPSRRHRADGRIRCLVVLNGVVIPWCCPKAGNGERGRSVCLVIPLSGKEAVPLRQTDVSEWNGDKMPRRAPLRARSAPGVPRFVSYYRVSTAQQGASGLGLEAQREAVSRHVAAPAA